jgi:hypothetical protein
MQVVYPVCCGLDGHPTQLTACLRRVSAPGQITTELRECSTTSNELVAFRRWNPRQGRQTLACSTVPRYPRWMRGLAVGLDNCCRGHSSVQSVQERQVQQRSPAMAAR